MRAVAVVAPVAHVNGSLLAHRVVTAVHAPSIEHGLQLALLCVAAHGSPVVRFAVGRGRHESPLDDRQVAVLGSIRGDTTHQVVLLVGHDPRSGRRAVIPRRGVAEVSGFHGSGVIIAAVNLGVAVIKAAAVVVMMAVHDPILPFRLVVHRGAVRVVVAKTHARRDEDAINLVAHDRYRRPVGDRDIVKSTHRHLSAGGTGRRLGQIVAMPGLVVNLGDPAISIGAESVLCGRVRVSAPIRGGGLHHTDIQCLAVRPAHDLIERPVVRSIQRSCGAVGCHARRATSGVNVTWTLRPALSGRMQV